MKPVAPVVEPSTRAEEPASPAESKLEVLDDNDDVAPPRPRSRRRWYGWQTLAVDGALALMLLALAEGDGSAALVTAGVGFSVTGPIVHLAHKKPGKMAASLALRAGSVALIAMGANSCDGGDGCGALVVGVLGVPAAIAVDAAVIAREDVPAEPRTSTWIAPWFARAGGGGAQVGGRF